MTTSLGRSKLLWSLFNRNLTCGRQVYLFLSERINKNNNNLYVIIIIIIPLAVGLPLIVALEQVKFWLQRAVSLQQDMHLKWRPSALLPINCANALGHACKRNVCCLHPNISKTSIESYYILLLLLMFLLNFVYFIWRRYYQVA